MKPQRLQQYIPFGGVNGILTAQPGDASEIFNVRYSVEQGWIANVGYESWWNFPDGFQVPDTTFKKFINKTVDSVYQWKRQGTNDIYTFVEQGGILYYMLGNKAVPYIGFTYYDDDFVIIQEGRHIPKLSEVGTQYINLGSHLLILNGYDRAIIFSGDRVWRDFGYVLSTSTPNPLPVQTDYYQGQNLQGATALWFGKNDNINGIGLGDGTDNVYAYKVTNISNLGAESAPSDPQILNWKVAQTGSGEYKYGVMIQVPYGQKGTVARRIYRTKNQVESGSDFYFLTQIDENSSDLFVDTLPDSYLTSPAPSFLSSTSINSDYNLGEVWDNRLWLAKGNSIIYSDSGIFEQFGVVNTFELGNTNGGDVTGLKAFYNNLIVFRQTSISVISTLSNGGYTISTVSTNIGTTATNSIVLIPQIGVMFMNIEGVWILQGGTNGGASITIKELSNPVHKFMDSRNVSLVHKTIAAYSTYEKEVWFHYPEADSTIPNMGIVLHFQSDVPKWSCRGVPENLIDSSWTAMTTTVDGRFLLGTYSDWPVSSKTPISVGQKCSKLGPLQVMSKSKYYGQKAEITTYAESIVTLSVANVDNGGHSWESEWYNLGNNAAMTRFYSVEIQLISYGDNSFKFWYQKDYSYDESTTSDQKMANSSTVFTTAELPVFNVDPKISKSPFTIGTSKLTEGQLIRLRYDVNTGLCTQFKFGLKSQSEEWHILSFNLLVDAEDLPVLNQSTRLQKGQSR